MSAEGKKKRGEAGQSNAKNIAFRYGGSKCNYSTTTGRTTSPYGAGSLLVRAFDLEDMLIRMGKVTPTIIPLPLQNRVEMALTRCTNL